MKPEEPSIHDALVKKAAERWWSVSEATAELSKETGYTRDEIAKELIRLVRKKELSISEGSSYKALLRYATSPYNLWFWGTISATVLSVFLAAISSGLLVYLRYIFGGALVMFLPGFSLVQLLYPKGEELNQLSRVALSVGLSALVFTPLCGLVLNYTPFGIRLVPVLVFLAGLTVIFLLFAVGRKHAYYKLGKGIS